MAINIVTDKTLEGPFSLLNAKHRYDKNGPSPGKILWLLTRGKDAEYESYWDNPDGDFDTIGAVENVLDFLERAGDHQVWKVKISMTDTDSEGDEHVSEGIYLFYGVTPQQVADYIVVHHVMES